MIERRFFNQLNKFGVEGGLLVLDLGFSRRNKDHIFVNVGMVPMVTSMGDLPRKVGHHESRMNSPSNNIIEQRELGEGAVSTFVTDNPHSGSNAALDEGIKDPSSGTERWRRQKIDLQGEPHKRRCIDNVAEQVCKCLERGTLKAMRRDFRSQKAIRDIFRLRGVSA